MWIILALSAVLLLILGFPVWLVFLTTSFWGLSVLSGIPLESVASRLFGSLDVYALLAVPGFIFGGEVMAQGGMSKRLVAWVSSLVGRIPGGVPITTIAASSVFGAISGSSTANVAALGKILYPILRRTRYDERFSLGLITATGAIDTVIPPSITMILFAVITGASIGKLFLAGFLPGLVIASVLGTYAVVYALRRRIAEANRWDAAEIWRTTRSVLWTLGAIILVFGGIYGGFFTPTEAAVALSAYAVFVSMVIYRELDAKGLWNVARASAYLTAKIFIIVAAASVFSFFLTVENVPARFVQLMSGLDLGPTGVLMLVNLIFLIVGMFMDPNSAILVFVPLLWPIAQAAGVDLLHFGIVTTVNLAIGMFTPPFGLNLFVASSVFEVPVERVSRSVLPYVALYLIALLIITYVPEISLWLPDRL